MDANLEYRFALLAVEYMALVELLVEKDIISEKDYKKYVKRVSDRKANKATLQNLEFVNRINDIQARKELTDDDIEYIKKFAAEFKDDLDSNRLIDSLKLMCLMESSDNSKE